MEIFYEVLKIAGGATLGLFTIITGVFTFLLYRSRKKLDALLFGDSTVLNLKLELLRARHPQASEEELLRMIVNREALMAGVIGFFTGLGGLVTLPLTLPLQMVATVRIQTRLINFLSARRQGTLAPETRELRNYAILAGAKQINHVGAKLILKLVLRFAPKMVFQALPVVGGIVGFLMDWLTTRGIGNFALASKD